MYKVKIFPFNFDFRLIHHYTGNSSKLSYEFGAHLPKRLWGLEFSEHKNRTF